jgi:hypothetical protein
VSIPLARCSAGIGTKTKESVLRPIRKPPGGVSYATVNDTPLRGKAYKPSEAMGELLQVPRLWMPPGALQYILLVILMIIFISPYIRTLWIDFRHKKFVAESVKLELEILKLRYEIQALKKAHDLPEIQNNRENNLYRDIELLNTSTIDDSLFSYRLRVRFAYGVLGSLPKLVLIAVLLFIYSADFSIFITKAIFSTIFYPLIGGFY